MVKLHGQEDATNRGRGVAYQQQLTAPLTAVVARRNITSAFTPPLAGGLPPPVFLMPLPRPNSTPLGLLHLCGSLNSLALTS
jgi:hypothetical protein